jgi:hypothetical protein
VATVTKHRSYIVAVACVPCALLLLASGEAARATDEIQVYNAGIANVGQFTIQQHLNSVAIGQKDPPFPGGIPSNRSLNGTPEFAYGMTDWWELGLYLPFSVQNQQFLSDAFKVRTLFVSPHAEQRNFFYGVNFELSYEMPKFVQTRWGLEIRPIIGVRNAQYEFIVNPIVDVGFGRYGEVDFAPAARLARNFGNDLFAGFEYYADLGEIGNFKKPSDQSHTLFAVTDFKLGDFDIDFGVGYGLTPESDRLVVKTIIGYAFLVPGAATDANARMSSGPVNPFAHPFARNFQP